MNLPVNFQKQMKELLGEAYDAFINEYDKPYFSALRVNTGKIETDELCRLLNITENVDFVSWEKRGIYYSENMRPGKSPYHEAGLYYIQEPSAMLPVSLLGLSEENSENLKVLDLCAAPGGKTSQIADYMGGNGLLIANEIVPSRAKILSENIERMGVRNAIVISADPRDISNRFSCFFDRVLVDAPCSGEGMFRKHPEAMDEWSPDSVLECADRQAWIMDCAADMLKHGGRMVYSTCTFNAAEDENSVNAFLERHPEFTLAPDGMHRIYPHLHNGEGHFGAVLIKDGGIGENTKEEAADRDKMRQKKKNGEKPANPALYRPYFDFLEENLTKTGIDKLEKYANEGTFLMFGENLYLAPCDTPRLSGIKVLRPGLHLGIVTKGRFEPSHALALHLKKEDVLRTCDFSEEEAIRYLKGETLNGFEVQYKKPNGWTLICVNTYSLGWAKNTNGMLKNHYPKGLRWM